MTELSKNVVSISLFAIAIILAGLKNKIASCIMFVVGMIVAYFLFQPIQASEPKLSDCDFLAFLSTISLHSNIQKQ